QRLSEVGQCGVLVAVVEVGDPLGTTDDPRDLGLVLEQEVIQQGAGRLLVAGVQDLAHLPFPRCPERVPVALAATARTGRRRRRRVPALEAGGARGSALIVRAPWRRHGRGWTGIRATPGGLLPRGSGGGR